MATCYTCPFFKSIKNGCIRCEFATIKPPDKKIVKEFAQEFCASAFDYKKCPFYNLLEKYYERKYGGNE